MSTRKVPFLDVGATYRELRVELDDATSRVLASGWYLLGRELETFEQEYASYVGAAHTVGVANGLDALTLGLRALGVGAGDEVIVPSNTYIATWLAVTQVGARVVPVEPDPATFCLDPERVASAITPRTRAILPVHLYGHPADLDGICTVARERGLRVLADGAQAHGARYKGRPVGAFGDAVAWSFYPGKNLGAFGDGGAVTTSDAAVAERIGVLRNYGSRVKYVNEVQGVNSRLDEVQAATLSVKLRHLDEWNARREAIARRYDAAFADGPLATPRVAPWAESAWHLYVVRAPERDALQAELRRRGVETIIHYPIPPHLQQAYGELGFAAGDFPISEAIHREVLSLPLGPHLSDDDVQHVIEATREAAEVCAGAAPRVGAVR
jgi:dTDP-4-amino-4,6-dideoxygalactose transaminase